MHLCSYLFPRLLHLAHCMVFPSIFTDWDDDTAKHWSRIQRQSPGGNQRQTLETYAKRWYRMVRYEHLFMIFWHALVNFLHCIPLFYTGSMIIRYHGHCLIFSLFTHFKSQLKLHIFPNVLVTSKKWYT